MNDVSGAAREGMHGLGANASGLVVVAWLDLREKGTRVYAAVSRDPRRHVVGGSARLRLAVRLGLRVLPSIGRGGR